MLPALLSMTARAVDVIGFLALGVFTAHITGNLVILAVHYVTGGSVRSVPSFSVPVFMLGLGVVTLSLDSCSGWCWAQSLKFASGYGRSLFQLFSWQSQVHLASAELTPAAPNRVNHFASTGPSLTLTPFFHTARMLWVL